MQLFNKEYTAGQYVAKASTPAQTVTGPSQEGAAGSDATYEDGIEAVVGRAHAMMAYDTAGVE